MEETVPSYIKAQAEGSFAYLIREAEAVSDVEASHGRRADWPGHKWGIGQDGSIAGIVFHVAAWKQKTLPILAPNFAPSHGAEDFTARFDDWPSILAWLRSVGADWNLALRALPDAEFDAVRIWEDGESITVCRLAEEIIQHDVQHAAQIEYIRQLSTLK